MVISNLVLEVTRKCQLKCLHCMRGDAQRMTMSHEVLWKSMQFVESICSLTITGGEPSLAPEVLDDLNDILYWRKISVGAFYIVSNGMNHNRYRRFLTAVEKLYGWCDEQDVCALTVSRDQFHEFNPHKHASKFEVRYENGEHYGEYPPYVNLKEQGTYIYNVRNEGRAAETQVGNVFELDQQKPWMLGDDGYVEDPLVYIAANGNVVSSCDMSFDRVDREAKGNVLDKSLSEIVESYQAQKEIA